MKALNTRSTQLEQELKTTQSQREQLQDRIQLMKTDHEEIIKQNGEDLTVLRDQVTIVDNSIQWNLSIVETDQSILHYRSACPHFKGIYLHVCTVVH